MRRAPTLHDRAFVPLFVGLVLAAWLALAVWSLSPHARYLTHDWTQLGVAASLCAALPAGQALLPALVYIAGWVLMTAAMMLPTTLPLVLVFRRLTRPRPDAGQLLALLLAGYLTAWLGFGLAAHLMGLALLALVQRSAWLTFNGWLVAAAVFLLAGLFQFSPLKHRCLEACRSPLGYVAGRWRGSRPRRESLGIGLAHGIHCVGCCWLLMLVMFAVGTGSIGWMLALGAVMALEKNSPWGRRLAAPLGLALVAVAVGMAARHVDA
jgi:predicted metal-binding membrane protein